MSWFPSFFAPSFAWLFALLVPLIIVYFLKLRRQRLEIPSLALWRQVINDQRVNAPFQKFKKNILLLLQVLLLSLLCLAAMQPFFRGNEEQLQYLPILIDCSASMGAVDAQGKTRLDLAREQVSELIEGLLPGQKLTLIAVNSSARRLTDFTDNKPLLREALNELQVTDVPSKLEDGLRLAQALSRTVPEIKVVRLYTDGNLPTKLNPASDKPMATVDFDLTFPIEFFQIPAAGSNLGITSVNSRRVSTDRWDVFIRVEASVSGSGEGQVILKSNGEIVGEDSVIVGAGESQRLVFHLDAGIANRIEVSIKPAGADSLTTDNVAWLDLPKGRDLTLFCPPNLLTFRHAIATIPGVVLDPQMGEDSAKLSVHDFVISDSPVDIDRDASTYLFVGVVPKDLEPMVDVVDEPAEIVDWQRDATVLQHVQLKSVLFNQQPQKKGGVEDTDIEELGYDILVYGKSGPVLVRKRDGLKLMYFLLCHTDLSTFPYRVGFPVLLSNIVNEALQQASLAELRAPATGVLPALELEKETTYRVTSPDGKHDERTVNEDGLLQGVSANLVGEYEVRLGGELVEKIGVGLLNPAETSLLAVDRIHFNELSVAAQEEKIQADKPLWTHFALAAFVLALIEWWFFQKRPAGVPD